MSNPSNLYAEKIFAEHPATLWALDDQVDYLSLVSEEERTVSSWKDISGNSLGLSAVTVTDVLDQPFPTSNVTKITGEIPTGDSGEITCISLPIKKFTQFDYELGTFAIGGYFYAKSPFITGIHIGYEYRDDTSGEKITKLKYFETLVSNEWIFLSETFQVPLEDSEMSIVIKINYRAGSEVEEDYVFFTNGITLGQWSEEFCATSLLKI